MLDIAVTEQSQVAEARRAAVGIAQRLGFDETAAGRVAIVATELATNLVKHGGGGRLLAGPGEEPAGEAEVLLIAVDKGPGMADVGGAMRDGMSTAGTAGNGLGAIRRQSHASEIYSCPGAGTVVAAWLRAARPTAPVTPRAWGAVGLTHPNEEVSGDGYAVRRDGETSVVMVVDGLGHGPHAAEAATQAQRLFDKYWRQPPVDLLGTLHAGLRTTRGAAVAVARVDQARRVVSYAGVGNIAGVIAAPGGSKRLLSHNGTVGHVARKIQALDYPLPAAPSVLIMHSDGLGTSWSLDSYPGLVHAHPTLIAAVLCRDFNRGRDDATALVLRVGG